MIRRIAVDNFQSHGSSRLDLGNFTAIVGPSSSGKTALLRLLDWLFYGHWDDLYPADSTKPTIGGITLDDGRSIVRMRRGHKNEAWILAPGEKTSDRKPMRDFGKEIPGIFDIINVRPVEMGGRDVNLNFSFQDDPLFLVNSNSWSKPARAQWIGRLYGAHLINVAMKLMSRDKLRFDADADSEENELKRLQERRKAFEGLDAQEAKIKALEGILERLEVLKKLSARVIAYRSALKLFTDSRWMFNIDPESAKSDLAKLKNFYTLRVARDINSRNRAKLTDNQWIIDFDVSPMKKRISRMVKLYELHRRWRQFRENELNLSSYRLPQVDSRKLKSQLALLGNLVAIRDRHHDVHKKMALIPAQLAEIDEALSSKYEAVRNQVLNDGTCPLCGNEPDITSEELVSRFKNLTRASK